MFSPAFAAPFKTCRTFFFRGPKTTLRRHFSRGPSSVTDRGKHKLDGSSSEKLDGLLALFREYGPTSYDPFCSQIEHAAQTLALARYHAPSDTQLQTAAVLHDVGHLLLGEHSDMDPADASNSSGARFLEKDLRHESVGFLWLRDELGIRDERILGAVVLHVAAKRYLCSSKPGYFETVLSKMSQQSFLLQGGMMSEGEVSEYEGKRFGQDAVTLRLWEDQGKELFRYEQGKELFRSEEGKELRLWEDQGKELFRKAKEQGAQTLEEQDKAIYELYVEDTGRGWETWLEERMCPLARTYIVG